MGSEDKYRSPYPTTQKFGIKELRIELQKESELHLFYHISRRLKIMYHTINTIIIRTCRILNIGFEGVFPRPHPLSTHSMKYLASAHKYNKEA